MASFAKQTSKARNEARFDAMRWHQPADPKVPPREGGEDEGGGDAGGDYHGGEGHDQDLRPQARVHVSDTLGGA